MCGDVRSSLPALDGPILRHVAGRSAVGGRRCGPISLTRRTVKKAHVLTACGLLLLGTWAPAWASDLENLSEFANQFCWRRTTFLPSSNVRFAPVEGLPAEARRPGFGTYRLRPTGYPPSGFRLGGSERLTLVSSLDPPVDEQLPRHLWHLISVPRSRPAWDGLLTNREQALAGKAMSQEDHDFLMARSPLTWRDEDSQVRRGPVYNWAPLPDKDHVRELWMALVGSPVIQEVVDRNESYDHQFYYVPVPPRGDVVSRGSWLHPSWRKVYEPGVAFGFVFDDAGKCIGSTTIDVKP